MLSLSLPSICLERFKNKTLKNDLLNCSSQLAALKQVYLNDIERRKGPLRLETSSNALSTHGEENSKDLLLMDSYF